MADYFFGEDPGPEIRRKLNEMVAIWQAAIDDAVGPRGWSPILGIASDGARRVHQIVDWTGGEGVKPTLTGYVGASGIVPNIANGVDIRGPQGVQGAKGDKGDQGNQGIQGPKGDKGDKGDTGDQGIQGIQGVAGNDGWTPVLAVVADGDRRVQQVVNWTGGQGTKPATGQYVGATGLVSNIAQAVDIRGPVGSGTGDVNTTGTVEDGDLTVFDGATGDLIRSGGRLDPLALPDIMPSLNLNLMQLTHDPRIVVSRATERTYWDQNGVLRVAPPNVWPLEYDPSTGKCLGRSVWGSRTNHCYRGNGVGGWTFNNASADGTFLSPDGTLQSILLAGTTVNAHRVNLYDMNAGPGNAPKAFQMCAYFPPGCDTTILYIRFRTAAGNGQHIRVALDAYGELEFQASNPFGQNGPPPVTADEVKTKSMGDGYFLISFVGMADTIGGTVDRMDIGWSRDGSETAPGTANTRIGLSLIQLEQGSFPSPYIPTEGSAVTREADNMSMPLGDWFNPAEGVLAIDAVLNEVDSANKRLLSLSDGTPNNRIGIHVSAGVASGFVVANNLPQANATVSGFTAGVVKQAFSFAEGDMRLVVNGLLSSAPAGAQMVPHVDRLQIGSLNLAGHANSYIQRFAYYPRRLSNAQLQELSRL